MRKKMSFKYGKILLIITVGTMIFVFPFCKKKQTLDGPQDPHKISYGDNSPTWSADGSKILFDTNRDGNWEIYTMKADGSGQTRLTENQRFDGYVDWGKSKED